VIDYVGYVGMILLLAGWAITRKRKVTSDFLNIAGALVMTQYGCLLNQAPIMFLNFIWFLIGCYNLKQDAGEKKDAEKRNSSYVS